MKKEKVLFAVAFVSFMFAGGETSIPGWIGVVIQLIWSSTCILISLFSIKRLLELEEHKKRHHNNEKV